MSDPASDLIVYAARLVRHVRRVADLPAATRVLSVLDETGPVGIGQLAAADGSSQPTMSAQVSALLDAGLVSKVPNPADARASLISLTETGRKTLAENRARMVEPFRGRLAGHSPEEIAIAVGVLQSLTEKGNQ